MENNEKIEKVIALIAAKADTEAEEIKPESTWADIGLDSLDTVELIMELENQFKITIEQADADNLATVGDVIKYIETHG